MTGVLKNEKTLEVALRVLPPVPVQFHWSVDLFIIFYILSHFLKLKCRVELEKAEDILVYEIFLN